MKMSEWKECRLGDIADVRDGTHDSPKQKDEGEYLITSRHIKNGKLDFSSAYKISLDDYQDVNRRSKVHQWDVLFSMIGTVGEMTIVDFEPNFAIKNIGLFKTNGDKDLANWIYYYFKSDEAKAEINAALKGSTQQYITLGDLRNFPISLPPLAEQKAIAGVLSSFDDKIDLLHSQNKTLEVMAEALFRQWFVEEAGEDWEEVVITSLFEVKDGTHDSPKPKEYGKKLITSKHLSVNSINFDNAYYISDEDFIQINKRSLVETGDILFSMIGTIGIIYLEQSENINYAIKNIGLFKTSQNPKWKYYFYLWLKSDIGKEFVHENRDGSTQEYISLTSLRNIKFNLPPDNKITMFNEVVSSYFEKIKTNQTQIRTLEKLRDTLLPKLMSGEVKVGV